MSDDVTKKEFTIGSNPCKDVLLDKAELIEFVGSISKEDVQNGSVLVFRVNSHFPKEALANITASIKQAVVDLFDGQVKAIILPTTIDVTILKDLLKEHTEDDK